MAQKLTQMLIRAAIPYVSTNTTFVGLHLGLSGYIFNLSNQWVRDRDRQREITTDPRLPPSSQSADPESQALTEGTNLQRISVKERVSGLKDPSAFHSQFHDLNYLNIELFTLKFTHLRMLKI